MSELIFEISKAGKRGAQLPACDVPEAPLESLVPSDALRTSPPPLPEVTEPEVVRHYVKLSQKNFSVDTHFYPLGSCTMKYNPKVNDWATTLPGFARLHPLAPDAAAQGALEMMWETERILSEISGMDAMTLAPAAGSHGEFTGLLMIQAYHRSRNEKRHVILTPDQSHGTNPASAAICGFDVVTMKSDARGAVDLDVLKKHLSKDVAALMLTNPSTLGVFEENVVEIARLLHEVGAQLYYDGANLNAICGITRPGDMGFDCVHINVHKTFTQPHGGGGPGAGPVGVKKHLEPFLPVPRIEKAAGNDGRPVFRWREDHPQSVGPIRSFHSNFAAILRTYAYIRSLGPEGLLKMSEDAVLNANYLLSRLRKHYTVPYDRKYLHEFVLSANRQKAKGVRALDIAKALLDEGFHAPTIYFPLIVDECLMIEPTETERKETLDEFADAMIRIAEQADKDPAPLLAAPITTPVGRLDEARAARQPILRWKPPS